MYTEGEIADENEAIICTGKCDECFVRGEKGSILMIDCTTTDCFGLNVFD